MSLWRAFVLGLVQGATEFLPISSSGHLVLLPWLFHWEHPDLVFDTTAHLGTFVAVLAYFWRDCWALLVAWWRSVAERRVRTVDARLAWLILLATIPAGVLGYLFEDLLEPLFSAPTWAAGFLLVTGTILTLGERLGRRQRDLGDLRWKDALLIGIAQAFAILPGISRSGATIATGLQCGLKREGAARFSFLLSIPITLGTGVFKLLELFSAPGEAIGFGLALGFLAALFGGYACIRWLLAFLRRGKLYVFAAYCWAVGLVALALLALQWVTSG